ncbi:MliC family protein [Acinetobacter sp.]|jgi:membrane-bound inhibitor of C-type lysozyme|uniref:MliC family protein n=1 Tax=Acinetobacter sp. TaxID=472 RepID=UPI0028375F3C|nr:MliC family protein [Acinetobacter sp.]MDR0238539.1 MliC family protein [Acinetobacter sp.]
MKKLLLISSILTVAFLVGCNAKDKDKNTTTTAEASSPVAQVDANESNEKTVKYETEDKKQFTLKTSDNFATATLTDHDGHIYSLKEVPAGSGMRLEGDNGVAIHSKGEEATIELAKDQSLSVKEVK